MWVPGIVLFLWAAVRALERAARQPDDRTGPMTAPLAYLTAAGERARAIVPLTWFTLAGLDPRMRDHRYPAVDGRATRPGQRRRDRDPGGPGGARCQRPALDHVGLWLSAVPLPITLVWTMVTLAAVSGPPANPGLRSTSPGTSGGGK